MLTMAENDVKNNDRKTIYVDGKYKVRFKTSEDCYSEGEFVCETIADGYMNPIARLTLHFANRIIQKTADDYFEAFCQIREVLEKENIYPFCFGACKNVYPYKLARGMYSGLKAYKLEFGVSAKVLIHIFDSDQHVQPVSVEEQTKYFEDYCNSFCW